MQTALTLILTGSLLFFVGCDLRQLDDSKGEGQADKAEDQPRLEVGVGDAQVEAQPVQATSQVETFAGMNTELGPKIAKDADTYVLGADGYLELEKAAGGGVGSGEGVPWIAHSPLEPVTGQDGQAMEGVFQFSKVGGEVYLWAKLPSTGDGVNVYCYYTVDGGTPDGGFGRGKGNTKVAKFSWVHNFPIEGGGLGDWWKSEPISLADGGGVLKYKIAATKPVGVPAGD
jgi:hypothetical protein